ncbi:hypothetical protein DMUE_5277 [Dictyocoela muelleri]|nr:hypothetical protein DMUE_5277 [Dictyocoela muelleri]
MVFRKKDCKGFVWIENESLPPTKQGIHSCRSNEGENFSYIAKSKILDRCKNSNEDFTSVFISESANLNNSQLSDLTSFKSLRNYTRRLRNEKFMYGQTIQNDIPLSLQSTLTGQKFLQFDSGVVSNSSRHVIFFPKNIKII